MKICFIRHGATCGNLKGQYTGTTNEPLCPEGILQIQQMVYPAADAVVSSPMTRCIQTAKLIYPNAEPFIYDDLREADFGLFEGKNYLDLNGNPLYQQWIDSGGKMQFPNGEHPDDFIERCCMCFLDAVDDLKEYERVSFVIHGGTVMSLLYRFAAPKREYYDYQARNGSGYLCEWNGNNLTVISEIKRNL